MIQMDESRAKIEASAVQLDLAIGAAKAFWNQFPDMATMIGGGHHAVCRRNADERRHAFCDGHG